MVHSVKVALRKVNGKKCLEAEQLATILCEVQAVANSRPLTCVQQVGEGDPLTPSSFLLGRKQITLPTADGEQPASTPDTIRSFWRQRRRFQNEFWEARRVKYLWKLPSAYASHQKQSPSPIVGQLVLVREPPLRLLWKLCRVDKVFIGRDNKIHSCKIKVIVAPSSEGQCSSSTHWR